MKKKVKLEYGVLGMANPMIINYGHAVDQEHCLGQVFGDPYQFNIQELGTGSGLLCHFTKILTYLLVSSFPVCGWSGNRLGILT